MLVLLNIFNVPVYFEIMQVVEDEIANAKKTARYRLNQTVLMETLTLEDVRKQLKITKEQMKRCDLSNYDKLVSVFYLVELANKYNNKLQCINASPLYVNEFTVAI